MKSALLTVLLFCGALAAVLLLSRALAFGQEGQNPKPAGQPPATPRGGARVVVDLGEALDRSTPRQLDATALARKDGEGLCKVHHEALRSATVPILYGLRPSAARRPDVEERLFPNAITSLEGGCVVMPQKEAVVLQCPKCVRAKERWDRRQSWWRHNRG